MRPFLALVTTVAIALMPTIVWAHGTEVSVSGEVRPSPAKPDEASAHDRQRCRERGQANRLASRRIVRDGVRLLRLSGAVRLAGGGLQDCDLRRR